MINVKNIVKTLEEDVYTLIKDSLEKNKAEKFLTLLELYKNTDFEDDDLIAELGLKKGTFYTLKSRLYDKIQEMLTSTMNGEKVELIKQVQHIPELLYNTDREISTAILLKLEEDLLEHDMPNELCEVFNALKKINFNNNKYFEYSKKYNKYTAIKLAIDKADDLFTKINLQISDYKNIKDVNILESLNLSLLELEKLNKVYESHHINFLCNLAKCSAYFVPDLKSSYENILVDELLEQNKQLIKKYKGGDKFYYHYEVINNYYFFVYYHHLKLHKKSKDYSSSVKDKLNSFFLMNHAANVSDFLIYQVERAIDLNKQHLLFNQLERIKDSIQIDTADVSNYIQYMKFVALCHFYKFNYDSAISSLLELQKNVVFKNYPHAEIDFKLFLAVCYIYNRDEENLVKILKSVIRNIKESPNIDKYNHALTFIKLLKIKLRKTNNPISKKVRSLIDNFTVNNKGSFKVLNYLIFDEDFTDIIKEKF